MHEAFWNGLFDTRWEAAPLGREAIRLVLWLRKRGYSERSYRAYAHAVVHLGRVLHEAQAEVAPQGLLTRRSSQTSLESTCRNAVATAGGRAGEPEQVRRGLSHLLAMLREEGLIAHPESRPSRYTTNLLEGYCRFLRPRPRARRHHGNQLPALRARLPDQSWRRG